MRKYLILFLIAGIIYGQDNPIFRLAVQNENININQSHPIHLSDLSLGIFWIENRELFFSSSTDNGKSWQDKTKISDNLNEIDSLQDLSAVLFNGRILVSYKKDRHYLNYSDDNGLTWSEPIQLPTGGIVSSKLAGTARLFNRSESEVWFVYSQFNSAFTYSKISYKITSSTGIDWLGKADTLLADPENQIENVNLVSLDSVKLIMVYEGPSTNRIIFRKSEDGGKNWSDAFFNFDKDIRRPKILISEGNLKIIYSKEFENDVLKKKVTKLCYRNADEGINWGEEKTITKYEGKNNWHNVHVLEGNIVLSFCSFRPAEFPIKRGEEKFQIFIGRGLEAEDTFTPPIFKIYSAKFDYSYPYADVVFNAAIENETVPTVIAEFKINKGESSILHLYDDGLHNDGESNDKTYGNFLPYLNVNDTLFYTISASDQHSASTTIENELVIYHQNNLSQTLLETNALKVPVDNIGNIGGIDVIDSESNRIYNILHKNKSVAFTIGFYLSGMDASKKIWGNGNFLSGRIGDYLPGIIGGSDADSINRIYSINSNDLDFSESWNRWRNAVLLGADFFDGNNDGIYNPIDLNGNGNWDITEDSPLILGENTLWSVFNDGVDFSKRFFAEQNQVGIEIQQTIFDADSLEFPELKNTFFVRYKLNNTGAFNNQLDSVYFSFALDFELNDSNGEFLGCDTLFNSSFGYEKISADKDNEYPIFSAVLLQGPAKYIENETYIDLNNNQRFDEGIDTALDSAFYKLGDLFNPRIIAGAKNSDMISHQAIILSSQAYGAPRSAFELRNLILGKQLDGKRLDLCDFPNSSWILTDCSNSNSLFVYPGQPVNPFGFTSLGSLDYAGLLSTGPFTLYQNEPVEIIAAFTADSDYDFSNAYWQNIERVKKIILFYSSNFTSLQTTVKPASDNMRKNYYLSQNYPNPFNPSTVIKFSIPHVVETLRATSLQVELKVFDILGREVQTLVNAPMSAGEYEFKFDGSNLPSGVYIYTLKVNEFIQSRKMVLLK